MEPMTDISNIERVVMKRVHRMRVLRVAFSNTALTLAVLTFALWDIGREVWVAKVFANMPHAVDVVAQEHFWLAAFLHAHFTVELFALVSLAALVLLARETARLITSLAVPRISAAN